MALLHELAMVLLRVGGLHSRNNGITQIKEEIDCTPLSALLSLLSSLNSLLETMKN